MSFNIIRNDITKLEVDAIVNAANNRLQAGGGVCGAIFAAAGKEKLQDACNKLGYCGTGEAVITKGFNLPAKYIIHTVGPIYGENPKMEEEQLYACYQNALCLARRKKLSSIAFPVISSGIFGYPKAEAMKIAGRAIKDFLQKNEMTVFLVVYDKDTFSVSEKLFSAVESFIEERMVKPDVRRRDDEFAPFAKSTMVANCNRALSEESKKVCEDAKSPSLRKEIPKYSSAHPPLFSKAAKPSKRTLQALLEKKTETFSEMLLRLIDEKGTTDVEVYKRANIDRKLFSKIRKRDYTPRKITVIALAIGLKLNLDETTDLLTRAGFALSDCNKFDIIIEYFIENENYDIFEINETLFAFEQPLLGA